MHITHWQGSGLLLVADPYVVSIWSTNEAPVEEWEALWTGDAVHVG